MGKDTLQRTVGIHADAAFTVDALHNHCLDLKGRQIWIHGTPIELMSAGDAGLEPGVEFMMANKAIKNFHLLRRQSKDDPVTAHLHTCGGIWEEGMAIYDVAKSMPFHLTMISYTHARSMSSLILQAADRRILMPNSYFMFHDGSMAGEAEARTFYAIADFYRRVATPTMMNIYVEKARKSPKFSKKSDKYIHDYLRRIMDKRGDVFLTAAEAVEWGFADEVFTSWEALENS